MKNENLFQQLGILLNGDLSEKITDMWYYKHPLKWWQFTDIYLYHAFIVLKTTNFCLQLRETLEQISRRHFENFLSDVESGIVMQPSSTKVITLADMS